MSGVTTINWTRKLAVFGGVAAILAAILVLSTRASHAGESCAALDTALQNNLNFIAGQQANPDAQSAARIANRQAVVDLIQLRRQVAGCTANVVANNGQAAAAPGNSGIAPGTAQAPGQQKKHDLAT